MRYILNHKPFFFSVFGGVLVWFIIFLLFPAKVVYPFSAETLWFIITFYVMLIFGYVIYPNKTKRNYLSSVQIKESTIYLIIVACVVSFIIRYIDLFLYRNVSFSNNVWENRKLLGKTKTNYLFIVASVFRQSYFIPLILVLKQKIADKKIVFISVLLFFLPLIEGYIRGGRNTFFMSFVLLFFTLLFFKKIKFRKKHLLLIGSVFVLLFTIATSIIMQREENKTDKNFSSLTTNILLNDFLQPHEAFFNKVHNVENPTIKKSLVSAFQIGQYYVHGIFEFDNVVKHYQKETLQKQYGKFTFIVFPKFTNKLGITKINIDKIEEKHPRGFTFITFFGGFYIDWNWFGLPLMFAWGMFQKHVRDAVSKRKIMFYPLFIFLLFVNFFMLTFNYLRSTGTFIILTCFFIIFVDLLMNYYTNKTKHKS